MNPIDKLSEIFAHFPGIGPRQAKRFVYYLLSRNNDSIKTLVNAIEEVKRNTSQCTECMRFFPSTSSGRVTKICPICSDVSRETALLMIVPRDADLEAVEKSGSYKGFYFVLGGSLPILEKEPAKRIRLNELKSKIERSKKELKEIILAMNANAEGENTADFIKDLYRDSSLTFSLLGRGLSTGTELEYADPETLKNALLHRTS
jgi:recombination protein RecR